MRTFFSYREEDSDIVHRVKRFMLSSEREIVALWEERLSDQDFSLRMDRELPLCPNFVLFVKDELGPYQAGELHTFHRLMTQGQSRAIEVPSRPNRRLVIVCLFDKEHEDDLFSNQLAQYGGFPRVRGLPVAPNPDSDARSIAIDLTQALGIPWRYDGLPTDPHLFDYEKDIIQHYQDAARLFPNGIHAVEKDDSDPDRRIAWEIYQKWLKGCPAEWPQVPTCGQARCDNPLKERVIGNYRPAEARVLVKALKNESGSAEAAFTFPEAGPRSKLYFPPDQDLRVAIMVSGGIAPGINAVIDGIVQRHWKYAKGRDGTLAIHGLTDGFLSKGNWTHHSVLLKADISQLPPPNWAGQPILTPAHAHEGGSILGTSRVEELLHGEDRIRKLKRIDENLEDVDILYIIGGDGTMKAAHALYEISCENSNRERKLSVVAIPKTMDNDILWVWQSFGFLSAVEKAREVIEHLSTEVQSNPRLCIVQLFGSDSGFVVSHAVLASATGHCILALIPEVDFSMEGILAWVKDRIRPTDGRPPHGIIVMAETAIPTDAMKYLNDADVALIKVALTKDEKEQLEGFDNMRKRGERIQGQTEDALRSAGLKIVKEVLRQRLKDLPNWKLLRVVTNEPRWQLRAIPPSCSDVIIGQRLGTLAVDNAMAGYTDFMISQWLTEYVLVPLKLVVLGRKRIPQNGIFWKSVLAKTGQPADLVSVLPEAEEERGVAAGAH